MRNNMFSLGDNPSKDEERSLIDLLPMLDMIFILLIFFAVFMSVNKIIPDVMAIDRSVESTSHVDHGNRQPVILHVSVDGKLAIDGQRVALGSLDTRWNSVPGEVEIVAVPQVQAEKLIAVMAELKSLGVKHVELSLAK